MSCRAVMLVLACSLSTAPLVAQRQPTPSDVNLTMQAPDSFLVRFETTKGNITLLARRAWSPLGVDRLHQLVQAGYYDGNVIYRVGPTASFTGGYVVQFGVGNSGELNAAWDRAPIADEPVRHGNARGTVNFARAGPGTRTVELAINLTANTTMDTVNYGGVRGFPPIAEVIDGMAVLDALNRQYGNSVFDQWDSVVALGRSYLDRRYPGLDRIIRARIVAVR